ncbi:hypothetical protein AAG570_004109 [Ranatra chinensis]|uniref:Uncharacterized protein n=1 Tax=Ranatra chinensis TaxID=642074 RepID=A0ABD0YPM5_9HEMI
MWTAYDAKLVGVALISCGTFATGLLPAWFGLGTRWRRPSTTLSSILCFGGGVLLATSLVHILPESREALGPWAEIVLCSGYFMLYLVDVLLQFINNPKTDSQLAEGENLIRNQSCRSYESIERSEPSVSFKQQQHIVVSSLIFGFNY